MTDITNENETERTHENLPGNINIDIDTDMGLDIDENENASESTFEVRPVRKNCGVTIAIVGRPNVGKSSLFNLWTKTRRALVHDIPGLTRDRIYGTVELNEEYDYSVIDTGGFEDKTIKYQPFAENHVWNQARAAIEESDLIIFLLDGREGLHPHDKKISLELRKARKPVYFCVNKIDSPEKEILVPEFYQLGTNELFPLSASHRYGYSEFRERLDEDVLKLSAERRKKNICNTAVPVCIVGRPNAGKSSILNRLVGEERAIVSEIAGTTRDTVDSELNYKDFTYRIVDTAGVRRRAKVKEKIESLSVMKSLQAIDQSEIVLHVIDAEEGFNEQDQKLASYALQRYKALIVVVNKWDKIPNKETNTAREYKKDLQLSLKAHRHFQVLFVSCLTNQRVHKILENIDYVRSQYHQRVPTARLNEVLQRAVDTHTPALNKNKSRRSKFYFATQVAVAPPTVVVKCNVADEIQESYKRYMTHRFREELGFDDTPMRIIYRGKSDKGRKVEDCD